MRTLTKLSVTIALALSVSTPAAAMVSIGLVQVGGTYDPSVGAQAGDTLILDITWSVGTGDAIALVLPAIVFDRVVQSFSPDVYGSPAGFSTENLYPATFAGPSGAPASKRDMNWVAYGDIKLNPLDPNMAIGWEKAASGGGYVIGPCTAGVFNSCNSLGTAYFVLSGQDGIFKIGGVGQPGGTAVWDGTSTDIAGDPALVSLGSFTIVPEPTTACLLGLGLVALAAASGRKP